ncbi:ATP-binding cassette domain-containing protein [Proteiniclasticum sp. C24MP]|uniref:ATP-binding cassette domain-containing protein n=1 Tax=Proteiniclasticum sp. C24MP TaxID=3374101 RepID=UPI003754E635
MFRAENISKSYGDLKVLENMNFQVEKNEVLAIVGPSGVGKSTLLKCIVQLEKQDSGDFYINEVKVDEKNRIRIGLVFQSSSLFQHLNVMDNLLIAVNYHKLYEEKEAVKKAEAYLMEFGLSDKKSAYPSELSGGQKQRIAIIRALLLRPLVLCFDEPTSSLDSENKTLLIDIIRKIKKDQAVIVVSHDEDFIERVADKKVILG